MSPSVRWGISLNNQGATSEKFSVGFLMATQFRLPDDLKDTLATEQWWLFNSGQRVTNNNVTPGTPGIDINVLPLWPQYTGKGIKVGVIDDGTDGNHEDFQLNYIKRGVADTDQFPEKPGTDGAHGTSAAGIIGANRNNLGTVGIAYEAKISSYKFTSDSSGKNRSLGSLQEQAQFDVSSNSWGGSSSLDFGNSEEIAAIKNAVTSGRSGLGTVFAWAGGNERQNVNPNLPADQQRGRNVNSGDYESSRYVIAVAAIDNKGVAASYSNLGAPLLVSAFGDDAASIATVDRTGNNGYNTDATAQQPSDFSSANYTNGFNGTSSATPMVSGVNALILQANPKLGYRDVQEILAYSARKTDGGNADWTFNGAQNWNGGGLHVNHNYGFGLIDATSAVRLAETWQLRSGTGKNEAATAVNEKVQIAQLTLPTPVEIPDNNPAGINQTFKINQGINLDKLELDLNIEHGQFQDLVVKLTSPDKTESVILDRLPYFTEVGDNKTDNGFKGTTIDFTFSSSRDWGETGLGDWTLNISDNSATNDPKNTGQDNTSGNNIGQLKGATLRLYGDEIINDNTYVYTNEFASFTDATRKTLSDTNDGNDIINTAAISDDVTVNLAPGSTSTLPGRDVTGRQKLAPQTLTIAPGSIIENVFAGDGNDSIVGNDAANTLYGGRGNDTLVAVGDGDTLIGYEGSDSLVGSLGNTTYILDPKTAAGSKIKNVVGTNNSTSNNLILNGITLTKTLAAGQNGTTQQGNDLTIDLNADGQVRSRDDLTIENFFLAGSGSFKNVGNLLGSDIPAVSAPTPTTPTPTTPTPTTPTPTSQTPTSQTPTSQTP
ncbi:S8 family serine peptidase, partial [Microcoleus sp. herbarium8]|uniref:S8 family serine peptidase n=1 Tax=Microcoleus sp. herbarium8 TaxID=3055436 RepID=UPI002FD70578